jgi:hypothetical protein
VEQHPDELNDKDDTETDDKQHTDRFQCQFIGSLKCTKRVSEGPVGINWRFNRNGCHLHTLLHVVHICVLNDVHSWLVTVV